MRLYPRLLKPPRGSFFLFGVRGVGKSTWARSLFPEARRLDLLALEPGAFYVMDRGLNRTASEWMKKFGAHACTDITGFSFIGHALEMATASHVGMVIYSKNIPLFPEAMEYAKLGLVPGGAHANRQFFSCKVEADTNLSPLLWTSFTILRPLAVY